MVGVLLTEAAEPDLAVAPWRDDGVHCHVTKPYQPGALVRAVQDAADYYLLAQNERLLRDELARINAELDEKIKDLDEANELLEYWVEFSPAVLYSLSCDSGTVRTSYISKNFSRLTGHDRTQAVVDPGFWSALILDQHAARYRQALAGLVAGDDSHAVLEYEVKHRAGNRVLIVDSMRAVRDGDGQTVEVVGAWLDVTGRS
jgi:PAS domain-containing protein